ncbi:PHB depolymerase family esterase [Methylopila sp. M107]|uniref:extracellular catalytic domain type 1 short-chain-length polyhydroxyalkanoate depolymerase n=1 Tax=Methylopila sp. M107 TaxID=1101190 RepID=UPI00036100E3|nr:PHB depolymerase family esterase [Methylopila sp. M107]
MNAEFATAMRRASQEMRAQNLTEATRLIQQALNGGGAGAASSDRRDDLPSSTASGDTANGPQRAASTRLPLGETLKKLKLGGLSRDAFAGLPGMASSRLGAAAAPPVPDGARWESRGFTCAAGSRSYRLYVPASAPERPRGLIVMLHGCTQNPDDFAAGTAMNAAAERHGLAVAYPEQTRGHNPNACWNWFEPKDQRRDAGEPAILAGLTQEIVATFGIDPTAVFVAGLSAGGAMAAVMAQAYPEIYAAAGVHSGIATNVARDVASAFAAMRGDAGAGGPLSRTGRVTRTIVFQGGADRTVHPSNADRILDAATPAAASSSTKRVAGESGGRGATVTVVADPSGETLAERWLVDGAGHAWSGGRPGGSYVDPTGPDASAEMIRFFLAAPPAP